MSSMIQSSTQSIRPAPHGLVLTLCWLFAILYGVWILPETVFIRHFCLVAGAVLGLYVIYPNRRLLLKKEAIPIWLIVLLMLWVTFHLFFIGQDFEKQWDEYTRVWKKIAVGSFFAVGLGFALISQVNNEKHTKQYWKIVYFGFLLPAITYFVKYSATTLGRQYGFEIPIYLILDPDHMGSKFGISRAWYVFFCLPAVALGIGYITMLIKNKQFSLDNSLIYLVCIPLTLLIFYIENDRLGTFLGFILVFLGALAFLISLARNYSLTAVIVTLLTILLSSLVLWGSFKQNNEWRSLAADFKVAVQVDQYDNWRYNRNKIVGWPINDLGKSVGPSNYQRMAWLVIGSRYIKENPLGYGLLSLSFGELDKQRAPDSEMSWSHSAWLDFTLGYGILGFILLFSSLVFVCGNSSKVRAPWLLIGLWALPVLAAVFLVKEISSEIFINTFTFLIFFAAALSINTKSICKTD
jgi:hypothetical protein